MKEEFILSKANLFLIFKFPKWSRMLYCLAIYIFGKILIEDGLTFSLITVTFYIMLPLIITLETSLLFFQLVFRSIPYKLIFDLENQSIEFVMSYTNKIVKINFSDIDKILDQITFLKFKCNNGKKYLWASPYFTESRQNEIHLIELIQSSGINFISHREGSTHRG